MTASIRVARSSINSIESAPTNQCRGGTWRHFRRRFRILRQSSGFPEWTNSAPSSTGPPQPRGRTVKTRPPSRSRASNNRTDRPRRPNSAAAASPATPPPITITSNSIARSMSERPAHERPVARMPNRGRERERVDERVHSLTLAATSCSRLRCDRRRLALSQSVDDAQTRP